MEANGEFVLSIATARPGVLVNAPAINPTTLGVSMSKAYFSPTAVRQAERVKELYMEGFRLQDLKRWHKGFKRKPQDQSLTNGSSLKVEKDDPLFVWPIPQHELDSPGSQVEPNESNK